MPRPNNNPPTGGPTRSFIASSVDPRRPAARSRSPTCHGRRDERHAGGVDDRLGRRQHRRNEEDHPDRHLVEQDHRNEAGHHDRPRHVQAHPQHTAVVAIRPRTTRKDEEQPRQTLRHGHAGDQTGVVGHRCGQQRQRDEPETVAEVRRARSRPTAAGSCAGARGRTVSRRRGGSTVTAPPSSTLRTSPRRPLVDVFDVHTERGRVPCRARRAGLAMLPGPRPLSETRVVHGV